jgi:hypothetical protein
MVNSSFHPLGMLRAGIRRAALNGSTLALKERLPVLLHEPQQASTRFRFAKGPWLPFGRLRTLFFLRDLPVS